jgi:protein-L-isoaspartate O-methyltransferase
MIEAARRRTPANVTCILGDVMRDPLSAEPYDAIVSVTAFASPAPRRRAAAPVSALRPGGLLAAVALPRRDLPRELPAGLLAATGHQVFGAAFAVLRARLAPAGVQPRDHAEGS